MEKAKAMSTANSPCGSRSKTRTDMNREVRRGRPVSDERREKRKEEEKRARGESLQHREIDVHVERASCIEQPAIFLGPVSLDALQKLTKREKAAYT